MCNHVNTSSYDTTWSESIRKSRTGSRVARLLYHAGTWTREGGHLVLEANTEELRHLGDLWGGRKVSVSTKWSTRDLGGHTLEYRDLNLCRLPKQLQSGFVSGVSVEKGTQVLTVRRGLLFAQTTQTRLGGQECRDRRD